MFTMKNHIPEGFDEGHLAAISDLDGSYIGDEDMAKMLAQKGIAAEAIPGNTVASIGFCEDEQRWYGWSHRAICSFGIGSQVSKGDCAYVPVDWDDFINDAIRFWSEPSHLDVIGVRTKDHEGRDCVRVEWTYASDRKLVPNTSIHGKISGMNMYPPEKWGRGEWVAETLEDAKQMAIDFANSVA